MWTESVERDPDLAVETEMSELKLVQDVHQTVFDALTRLPPEARQRVLQGVATLLGMPLATPLGLAPMPSRTVTTPGPELAFGDFAEDRTMSAKAFIMDKKPRTDVERVACLAYYLTHYRDTPYFRTVDISKLNTEAAQQKLSNPSYAVENAGKSGYLVSATKGQKQLSAAGELFVQALPDRGAAKEAMAQARPRRSARKKTNSPPGERND